MSLMFKRDYYSFRYQSKKTANAHFWKVLEVEKKVNITSHTPRTKLVALLEFVALVALVALLRLVTYTNGFFC